MDRHYSKKERADLKLFTLEVGVSGRILRGRALYNDCENEMTFVENTPRGARSVEVGRTVHGRCVRRPDGLYTFTLRIDADIKYLRANLVAEVNEIASIIENDRKGVSNGRA